MPREFLPDIAVNIARFYPIYYGVDLVDAIVNNRSMTNDVLILFVLS